LRRRETGDDADRRLPVFLYLHRLRRDAAAQARRLLCVLFLRLGSVPADPGRTLKGAVGRSALLHRIAVMESDTLGTSRDWLQSPRGVVFILNMTDTQAAHAVLEELPLGKAHLMTFQLTPIGPLNPLRQLLVPAVPH
jgi:hypothetical protein